jgi:hypothetical protein
MGHVDEVLGFEDAGLEEVWAVECAVGAVTLHSNPGITLVCFQSFSGI